MSHIFLRMMNLDLVIMKIKILLNVKRQRCLHIRRLKIDVDLGWEPQWILIKPDANTTNWQIFDSRRGIVTTGDSNVSIGNERALNPNK